LNLSVLKADFRKCHHLPRYRLPLGCELRFACKHDVTVRMAIAIEPLAKVQPLSKIFRSEMLHSLHVVWMRALCMQCSPHSRVGNTKTSCNSSRTNSHHLFPHLVVIAQAWRLTTVLRRDAVHTRAYTEWKKGS
jgi:hypothetical protein